MYNTVKNIAESYLPLEAQLNDKDFKAFQDDLKALKSMIASKKIIEFRDNWFGFKVTQTMEAPENANKSIGQKNKP